MRVKFHVHMKVHVKVCIHVLTLIADTQIVASYANLNVTIMGQRLLLDKK